MKFHILNTREVDEIKEKLREQYGFEGELDYAFLKNNQGKIYVISEGIADIDFEELNIDSLGMYFASEDSGGNLRMSIEGSQVVGPHATENVFELDEGLYKLWAAGHDIPWESERTNFLIIKHGDDYLGAGKIMDDMLTNFIPKSRRTTGVIL